MSERSILIVAVATALVLTAGCSWAPRAALAPRLIPMLAGQVAEEKAEPAKHGATRTALLYLPNRLLDLTDVVSVSVGVPLLPSLFVANPVHVNAHVTRAAQLGVGDCNNVVSVGKGYRRRVVPWVRGARELSGGPVTMCHYTMDTGGEDLDFRKAGILTPADRPFSEGFMDYWAIGVDVAVLPVAAKAEIHPVEIADALLGFFLIDLSGDDL